MTISILKKFSGMFKKKQETETDLLSYFELEDDVEAALTYLDNHKNVSLDEYLDWLEGREKAMKTIRGNRKKHESN